MINQVLEARVQCPYCWEKFILLVDGSLEHQEYVEDCEICCRPIDFSITIDDEDQLTIQAHSQAG